MGCLFLILLMLSTRAAIVFWWLIDMDRWQSAFASGFVPILGFAFLPATTLVWVAVAPTGEVLGLGWLWLALAFMGDIGSLARGGSQWRGRSTGLA